MQRIAEMCNAIEVKTTLIFRSENIKHTLILKFIDSSEKSPNLKGPLKVRSTKFVDVCVWGGGGLQLIHGIPILINKNTCLLLNSIWQIV